MAIINFDDTTPAPPAGKTNVKWQGDSSSPRNVSAYMPDMVGDTGSGGASGAVPAPAAGDAAAGKFLKADGTFAVPPGSGVTSVGLSMPAEFSVSGSPVTGAGTLTVSKANESSNQVYAGPSSGSPAPPGFRALVAADIPAISLTAGVSGILPVANGGSGGSAPGLVAGANVSITGSWPNQTISASGASVSTTHSESLTDGNSNFIFAAGDIVTVVGVPN